MRLFNRRYKVVLKFTYGSDAKRASISLASYGVKFKTTKDNAFDHRIKCWFKDFGEFRTWLKEIVKTDIKFGIV